MNQPIPPETIRGALYGPAMEKQNAYLRFQLADQHLNEEARVLFAKHGQDMADWQIDMKSGVMVPVQKPAETPV